MNGIEVHLDDAWICFTLTLENKLKAGLSRFERMLSKHLKLPFVKFGLVDEGQALALLAQVPRERHHMRRFPEIHESFLGGSLWYRSLSLSAGHRDAARQNRVRPYRKQPSPILKEAERMLISTCEDNSWQLSENKPRNFCVRLSANGRYSSIPIEIRFAGETVSFRLVLLDTCGASIESSRALRLWMMRINGVLNYARVGLSQKRVVSQVKVPIRDLSAIECREAISALVTSHSGLSSEARALTYPDVAVTYLEETARSLTPYVP
ncbi:MAG: hypothetical protein ACE5OP_03250 [Candidatus Glassbacteria bacterium]